MTARSLSKILFLGRMAGVLGILSFLGGCQGGVERGDETESAPVVDPEVWEGDVVETARMLRPHEGTDEDWEVFRSKVAWIWEEGLHTRPMGQAMKEIGTSFLGIPYGPKTLEVAGEEDVVVNFEELDCVTFVENVLALARFTRVHGPEVLQSDGAAREAYRGALREIRYRGARVDGYPSRLHYFSDWIRDNEAKGLVRELTQEMGGEEDFAPIDFMTTHPDAYRQLANGASLEAIQRAEYALTNLVRFKIGEEEIRAQQSEVQNGDIIATTSTVAGLDVAHTGLAYWEGAELHLLHAPLVGGVVEVSRLPLGDRILRFEGQDGIRVVRPLDPGGPVGGDQGR